MQFLPRSFATLAGVLVSHEAKTPTVASNCITESIYLI